MASSVTAATESAQSRPAGEHAGRASKDSAAAGSLGSEQATLAGEAPSWDASPVPLLSRRMCQGED